MWGKAIVAAFIFFALFIGTLVTICVRQDNALVTRDYYAEEIDYQQQIDRISNTANLAVKPKVAVKDRQLVVDYQNLAQITTGTLQLYRPSDSRMDRLFQIKPDTSRVVVLDLSEFTSGLYKVKLNWEEGNSRYYLEQSIFL